ncbi:aldo/keto reductase [Clostridium sp. BNL1100]|uniref:aldo/keto reductase n=1 Tax=Clostridium sp. BNL1100 TaxID=755731 RepID=UPI0006836E69|nr:aldo/keto reductase [Clostridium sp. BNL1100]
MPIDRLLSSLTDKYYTIKQPNSSTIYILRFFTELSYYSFVALYGVNLKPDYIERACDASLKRLNTDHIDVYQLHEGNILISDVEPVCMTLDKLVKKVRFVHMVGVQILLMVLNYLQKDPIVLLFSTA